MAEIDESRAVGAEKSPKKVGGFVLVLMVVLLLVLGIALFFVHHAATVTR